jgi:hypothetical protein
MAKQAKAGDVPKTRGTPWWLDVGDEDCPHCDQTYSYRAEVRCFECDAPICQMCIVRIDEHVFCPECRGRANK